MKATEFCYWLQGYFELMGLQPRGLNPEQEMVVRRHLALVFKHEIDPSYGNLDPKVAQEIHDGPPSSAGNPDEGKPTAGTPSPWDPGTMLRC